MDPLSLQNIAEKQKNLPKGQKLCFLTGVGGSVHVEHKMIHDSVKCSDKIPWPTLGQQDPMNIQ